MPSKVAHHAHGSTSSPRALLVARLGKWLNLLSTCTLRTWNLTRVSRRSSGTTLPEAPDGGNFRWPTASEEEQSYDEQLDVLVNTGVEVLEVSFLLMIPNTPGLKLSRSFQSYGCGLCLANAQVGPIGTVEHGNRAVTSAARSGLPIWIAVSAALDPPPTAAGGGDADEIDSRLVIPELCVEPSRFDHF